MSEVAGAWLLTKAQYLERAMGGRGILSGRARTRQFGKNVVVLGGGIVGTNAFFGDCRGLGRTSIYLGYQSLSLALSGRCNAEECCYANVNPATVREVSREADLIIGGVLIPGALAPKLITRAMLKI